jgi:hypothetical protein
VTVTFAKDPSAVLDYAFDWTEWLADGETIDDFTITLQSGITSGGTDTNVGGVVTAWVAGGTAGTYYTVACLVETSQGRTDERTIKLHVVNR